MIACVGRSTLNMTNFNTVHERKAKSSGLDRIVDDSYDQMKTRLNTVHSTH